MTTSEGQCSFAQLIAEFRIVEIPIIQRDYAQGRPGQEELRKEFLSSLKRALDRPETDVKPPLDLDFVYGTASRRNNAESSSRFAPLDGQQRLTTLFLLHWYLAWVDAQADDFRSRFVENRRSRLRYEVRPSSHDFFDQLANNFPSQKATSVASVRAVIEDSPWFFRSWKYDPTIVSTLTMLEAIHGLFRNASGYYSRIIDLQRPRITFHLLELRNFGLSDDLYIKMNARGKPLTPFETFKARLEQHLNELVPYETRLLAGRAVTVREYFSHQMDVTWAELFWRQRDRKTNLYDAQVMQVIKAVALISVDTDRPEAVSVVNALRSDGRGISYAMLFEVGALTREMLRTLETALDYWADAGLEDHLPDMAPYGAKAAFVAATSDQPSHSEMVKFASFCLFAVQHPAEMKSTAFGEWSRVVWNLVENTEIERPSDYLDALKSLRELAKHAPDILSYLAGGAEVSFFNRQQVREERIKAGLSLRSEEWKRRLRVAERHGYFNGQVEFLLSFSGVLDRWLELKSIGWSEDDDGHLKDLFSFYLKRAELIFELGGLRSFKDFLWERALLSVGDYTLQQGSNKCLLANKAGTGEKRPTWKLLLRGHLTNQEEQSKRLLVKKVLDGLNENEPVEASLQTIIASASVAEPWRRMLVAMPEMIAFCGQRMLRLLPDGAVYLISKIRTTSEHVELWTYYLWRDAVEKFQNSGDLAPFRAIYVSASSEWYVPFIDLKWNERGIAGKVEFAGGRYHLKLTCKDAGLLRRVTSSLAMDYSNVEDGTQGDLGVTGDQVLSVLRALAREARDLASEREAASANETAVGGCADAV